MPFGLAPLAPGFPPLPASPSLHAVPTTPVDRIGAYRLDCGALPHRVLPDSLWPSRRTHPVGIHAFMFRGLLRLHSRYGLQFCSPTSSGLCHEAPVQTVTPPNRSSATQSYRFLLVWNFHPLVIRAIGAHVRDIKVEQAWTPVRAATVRERLTPGIVQISSDSKALMASPCSASTY
jgi:hypothetical protein